MKQNLLSESFDDIGDSVKSYIDAHLSYWKLHTIEKLTQIGTSFFLAIISIFLIFLLLLFGGFAFSYWFGNNVGTLTQGFLISAGFYILLGVVVFLMRKTLFSNPILRELRDAFFED